MCSPTKLLCRRDCDSGLAYAQIIRPRLNRGLGLTEQMSRLGDRRLTEATFDNAEHGLPHFRDQKLVQIQTALEHGRNQDTRVVADDLAKNFIEHTLQESGE